MTAATTCRDCGTDLLENARFVLFADVVKSMGIAAVGPERMREMMARARGDDVAYRDFVNRYRQMAKELGFEGHIAMADAM